ncbi:unnamed protein product [Cylindrotheca closterium]|uniref:Mitochondrial carrier protein n=1 Tax=Cylindrotheca closterium TaxID=2856 RepID=A0AAD2FFW7_9STRA|nr:unnamed protein product [Cylindrotheca closterium]
MPLSEAWVDFIAGWASGAVSVLAIQPVDTILTRFQANGRITASATLQDSQALINRNGFKALWRGSSAMITAVPMQNAMLMGGYGIGKQWAEDASSSSSSSTTSTSTGTTATKSNIYTSVFIGGCAGGIAQSFLMSPVELFKVNQQVNVSKSVRDVGIELASGFGAYATTASTSAATGSSWRGLNATLLRDAIPHGVWFASYEWCKTAMTQALSIPADGEDGETSKTSYSHEHLTVPLFSGAFAATVAWGVGYPADIIKTRIQATEPHVVKGIFETGLELIAEANGNVFQGLYRGFGLKLVRSIPASMIGFTTYEFAAYQLRT